MERMTLRQRQRDKERKTKRQKETKRERESLCVSMCERRKKSTDLQLTTPKHHLSLSKPYTDVRDTQAIVTR